MTDQNDTNSTRELCLANASLVLKDRVITGALHIVGDRIADVTEGDHTPTGAIDCGGDLILPGLIEVHTDNLERHLEPRPKVNLPHIPAILAHDGELASTGITTVFDALRLGSILGPADTYRPYAREVASEILALRNADMLRVRHLIHLRAEVCSETLVEELSDFSEDDRVGLVSVMDHTPGQRQFRDLEQLRVYYKGKYAMSDDEFEGIVTHRTSLGERVRTLHERAAIDAAARLGAALASHDDTDPAHVETSQALGIRLAEFPTTREAAEACRDAGMQIIMGAPNLIRGGSHSGNVSAEELAEAGLLDIVSSDYVPSLLLSSVFKLGEMWADLPRAVRTVTSAPAEATNLTDRGQLAPGYLADAVRVHMHKGAPVIRAVWRGADRIG